jgi:TonB family protein
MLGDNRISPKKYQGCIAAFVIGVLSGQSALAEDAAAPAQPSALPVPAMSCEQVYVPAAYAEVLKHRHYPMPEDKRMAPVGMVRVAFTIDRSGKVIDATIAESAGSILNKAALETIRQTDFPPFPRDCFPGEPQHRFSVELNYSPN